MQTTQTGNVKKGNFHVDDAENAYFFVVPVMRVMPVISDWVLGFVKTANTKKAWVCKICRIVNPSERQRV